MRNDFGPWIPFVLTILIVGGFAYPVWKLERWFHYKFSYQSQVQNEIKPLAVRIENLEKRVSELEKKQ